MHLLRLIAWDGEERELRFVGWFDDHRRSALVFDEQVRRRVMDLHFPSHFGLHFRQSPMPTTPPVEIRATSLHLPPCCASEQEASALFQSNSNARLAAQVMSPWRLAAREVLFLEPRHDRVLTQVLAQYKRQRRKEQAERLKALEAQLQQQHPSPEDEAAARQRLKDLFTATIPDPTTGELRRMSEAKVTANWVRDGWGGFREQVLQAEWLRQHGLTAESLNRERLAFRRWLKARAVNARANSLDFVTGVHQIVSLLQLSEGQWEVLEAAVRWRVCCADGSVVWLDHLEERDLASPEEATAFQTLETALGSAAPVTVEYVLAELGGVSRDWLRRLCPKAGVPYPPSTQGHLARLKQRQASGKQARLTKLRSHNKAPKGSKN